MCSARLTWWGLVKPARHQVEELPRIATQVIEHQCHRVRCPGCGARRSGELPSEVAGSAFGPRFNDSAAGDMEITAAGAAARTLVVHARKDLEIAAQVNRCSPATFQPESQCALQPLLRRPERDGGVDVGEVREALREVAEQLTGASGRSPPGTARGRWRRATVWSNTARASSSSPASARHSTSQNEQHRNAPSSPSSPSSRR